LLIFTQLGSAKFYQPLSTTCVSSSRIVHTANIWQYEGIVSYFKCYKPDSETYRTE